MIKRIGLLLTLAAVVGVMVAISAAGAAADPVCTTTPPGPGDMGRFTVKCVETTTTTQERTEPATQACEVGRSGRTGTQEGTQTNTYEITTTTTTTTVYQGMPSPGKVPVSGPDTTTTTSDPVLIEEGPFTPTGPCRSTPGPQR
jgi:hypothetical protein